VLETPGCLLRQLQCLAQRLVVSPQFRRPLFGRVEIGAHRFVICAELGERVAQAGVVGLFLLQRVQRGADGPDELAEGILDVVERGDLTAGVDQQVAQRLVAPAEACAESGKCRLVVPCVAVCAVLIGRCGDRKRRRRDYNTSTHKEI
jgi:hypothetical protein